MKRLLALAALAASAVFAQTSGTITVTGSIPDAVSMTNSSGTAISSTVSLGALTAANSSTLTAITPVDLYIRSNKQFKLSASATLTGTGTDDATAGHAIQPADIGFGIVTKTINGALVTSTYAASETIAGGFDYTGGGAIAATTLSNGLATFTSGTNNSLADIASSTQVLQGGRVSQKGNIQTTTNAVRYALGVATLPQYFTPTGSFTATITLTIATF